MTDYCSDWPNKTLHLTLASLGQVSLIVLAADQIKTLKSQIYYELRMLGEEDSLGEMSAL